MAPKPIKKQVAQSSSKSEVTESVEASTPPPSVQEEMDTFVDEDLPDPPTEPASDRSEESKPEAGNIEAQSEAPKTDGDRDSAPRSRAAASDLPKRIITTPTRPKDAELASSEAEPTHQADQPTKVAQFKEFGNGSGAMLFGEAAEVVSASLDLQPQFTNPTQAGRSPSPYLKLDREQVSAAATVLQEEGWEVKQKNAQITLHGQTASVTGVAAQAVAQEFGFDLNSTNSGKPKVKFSQEKLEEVETFLKADFVVSKQEAPQTDRQTKPVVVFRESLDSDNYKAFEASAKNLAQAMGREPDKTPGGRDVVEVTPSERKQLMRDMGDKLDMSIKPMPEAKMSLYADGGGNVIGAAAVEVAAALNLETETVTRKADGATFPKVNLTADQIEPAKAALADQFVVKPVELPAIEKAALIKTDKAKEEIIVVGDAAQPLADALGQEPSISGNGKPYVRLPASEMESTKTLLKEVGFDKFDIKESAPAPQRLSEPDAPTPKPKPRQKAAAGMEL